MTKREDIRILNSHAFSLCYLLVMPYLTLILVDIAACLGYLCFVGQYLRSSSFSLARIFTLRTNIYEFLHSYWPVFSLCGPISTEFFFLIGPYLFFAGQYLRSSSSSLACIFSLRANIYGFLLSHWSAFSLCGPISADFFFLTGPYLHFVSQHLLISSPSLTHIPKSLPTIHGDPQPRIRVLQENKLRIWNSII